MFAQVIQGRTNDPAALWNRFEEWDRSLKPGAQGFLGSTGGVSEDGEVIVMARFESEDSARSNSDRPEQSEWWAETEKNFEGEVRFYDSTDVETTWGGGTDDAGFVQVIQGRLPSREQRERWKQAEDEAEEWMRENRPDVMGSVTVWQDTDFTQLVYFTSEEEARIGEQKQPSEASGAQEDWMGQIEDLKFVDLKRPYFSSP
jgi:hypothetical protein